MSKSLAIVVFNFTITPLTLPAFSLNEYFDLSNEIPTTVSDINNTI